MCRNHGLILTFDDDALLIEHQHVHVDPFACHVERVFVRDDRFRSAQDIPANCERPLHYHQRSESRRETHVRPWIGLRIEQQWREEVFIGFIQDNSRKGRMNGQKMMREVGERRASRDFRRSLVILILFNQRSDPSYFALNGFLP